MSLWVCEWFCRLTSTKFVHSCAKLNKVEQSWTKLNKVEQIVAEKINISLSVSLWVNFANLELLAQLKIDQSWAGHAVVYLYWDVIMNQWSIVFYYQISPLSFTMNILWWNDSIILTFYYISFNRKSHQTTCVKEVFWSDA